MHVGRTTKPKFYVGFKISSIHRTYRASVKMMGIPICYETSSFRKLSHGAREEKKKIGRVHYLNDLLSVEGYPKSF